MIDGLYQAMQQSVADTLENMAFIEVHSERGGAMEADPELMVGSLLMHDPVQAEFRLLMPRDLLLQIAEILYSLPLEELEPNQLEDTLAELLNTIAGKFLNQIMPGQVYRLGLPEVESHSEPALADGLVRWLFSCGGDRFSLEFTGESLPVETLNH